MILAEAEACLIRHLSKKVNSRGGFSFLFTIADMNYARFINRLSSRRKPSILRELNRPFPPEFVLFTAGKPNPALFPFTKATFETDDGEQFVFEGDVLKEALQYQNSLGVPALVDWLKDLQQTVHKPPRPVELMVSNGSQDGLCKAFEMVLNEGDPVVLEDFIYPGVLALLNPFDPKYIPVKSDGEGMIPSSLKEELAKAAVKPKVIYINPTGANPTGTLLPTQRRHEIYQLACDHDLLILEDDPYFYLQFSGKQRTPSFLSLDEEGRVLRFDSFSKVLSSGLRLGFVTGPKPLVDRIMLHVQVSVLHATSLSQYVVLEVLKRWGREGFFNHVDKVESFYMERRDAMVKAAEKHLTGLCEWSIPGGGMFLWMKVKGIEDTWDLIMDKATKENVMVLPGKAFQPLGGNSPYIRTSFSITDIKDFDVGFERLAKVLRENAKP